MKITTIAFAAESRLALASLAKADDHLINALDHGLKAGRQPFHCDPTGRNGNVAPGQGSPFAGGDTRPPPR